MHTLDQLETLVRAWSTERGIYEHSTPQAQTLKALGNSWAVPVARWIGERIQQVEET